MKLHNVVLLLTFLMLVAGVNAQQSPAPAKKANRRTVMEAPAKAEVDMVAAMLSEKPVSFGQPITDRATWDAKAKDPEAKNVIAAAERILKTPMPEKDDSVFLQYTTKGSRSASDRLDGQRRSRFPVLVVAEMLENKGRFLPQIEKEIRSICAEKTWVGAAHDGKLTNFKKTQITVDLMSSAMAWNLATVDCLLGDKLSPALRKLIRDEVKWRIFDPFHLMMSGQQAPYWLMSEHNWNSVCLAGVTGAALGLIDSKEERAFFICSAVKYSMKSLAGFTPDGYCGEGTGYWSYGYGHYVLLAEIIRLATQDKIDLLARPEAVAPAAFASRFEVVHGIYPAFADTGLGSRPSLPIMQFVNERYGFGLPLGSFIDFPNGGRLLFEDMMYAFPVPVKTKPAASALTDVGGPRSWFDSARILICRPGKAPLCKTAAAIIGSDNGVNHNHNDVGSYIVVVGKQIVIADPGSEQYTARTFSAKRYVSNALNSFGHNVPLVAGEMQDPGAQAKAVTLKSDFTDEQDTLKFDIRSAYPVKSLTKLERTYIYSRKGLGGLTVIDEAAFTQPESFETALVTFGTWKQTGPQTLKIEDGGEALNVEIDTGGVAFEVVPIEIKEQIHAKKMPTRLGIRLKEKVAKATVSMKMTPAQ